MKKLILTLILVLLLQGCSMSVTGGVGFDAFYPEGKTAKGGSFGDPAESRRQKTAPTTGHMRNNEGNAVDRWLFKHLDTSPRK